MAQYSEDCCWNDIRDHCPLHQGEQCGCACHTEQAAPPIEVRIHGRYGSGPMPVDFRDALASLVQSVAKGVEDGTIGLAGDSGMPTRIVSGREWRQRAEVAEAKVGKLENLLARAYPWLHNPYRADDGSAFDFALAAEGDEIVRDVELAIQHLPDDKEH